MNTGAKIFIIIGVALGVFLVIYIGTSMMGIFNTSKGQVEDESGSVDVDCMQYSFTGYVDGDSLHLTNLRLSSFQINELMISYGTGEPEEFTFKRFAPGEEKVIDLGGLEMGDEFLVYPKGCSGIAKTCEIATGECS